MKALTLTQPWATLVAIGAKKIETRSWNTNYRGKLAIHAAKGFPQDAQHLCFVVPFRDYLGDYVKLNETYFGKHKFPLGAVIATCDLVKVIRIYANSNVPGKPELMFGDYSVGRYMWILENVEVFPEPIPAKGALGLWDWSGLTLRAPGRAESSRQNDVIQQPEQIPLFQVDTNPAARR